MKVLMVSRWLWEERRRNGNQPGFFGELVQAIVEQGIDLTVLSQASDAGSTPEPRPVDGINIHVYSRDRRNSLLWPLDKLVKLWSGYRKGATEAVVIRKFIQQHGPFDAVVAQCEEPDGLSCALASLLGKFPPLVTCVHDLRYQFQDHGIRFIRKSSLGFVFKRSVRVMANSLPTATWLHRQYGVPETKIGQCRIHLTRPFLQQAAQNPHKSKSEERRILFLGALNRKKAPDVFLRAALLLASELPDWTFVLVGPETTDDSAYRTTLQSLVDNPLISPQLENLGRLEPSRVIEEIGRSRLVVCPSRIETFSRTTIEALALGRPVIVTETTGAAQWIRSTGAGSVVPSDDPEALALAIRNGISRDSIPDASTLIAKELTAPRAASDWIREVHGAILAGC